MSGSSPRRPAIVRHAVTIVRRPAILTALLALCLTGAQLALAVPAAQALGTVSIYVPGSRVLSATSVDVKVSGSLAVRFHGDQGAGCAAHGLCGYSGVVVWSPETAQSSGSIEILKLRKHRRVSYFAALAISGTGGSTTASAPVSAVVHRDIAGQVTGTCADASSPADSTLALPVHHELIAVGVLGRASSLLSTRCAGPLDLDLARFAPSREVAVAAALRGHRRVDLRGTSSFAGGGFAGTVRSTLILQLGGAQSGGGGQPSSAPSGPRERAVTEPLTLVKASGALKAQVQGAANPGICVLLDSCGLRGTITVPRPPLSRGALIAYGPARRPYRDFLAALGLSRRGNAAGILVAGSVRWQNGGRFEEDLVQGGECRDSGSLGAGGIVLATTKKLTRASYYASDSLRTRCPGPGLGGAGGSGGGILAAGATPLRDLARRQFSIAVPGTGTLSDDGYTERLTGSLSLTFRRGRVSQRTFRGSSDARSSPTGAGPAPFALGLSAPALGLSPPTLASFAF